MRALLFLVRLAELGWKTCSESKFVVFGCLVVFTALSFFLSSFHKVCFVFVFASIFFFPLEICVRGKRLSAGVVWCGGLCLELHTSIIVWLLALLRLFVVDLEFSWSREAFEAGRRLAAFAVYIFGLHSVSKSTTYRLDAFLAVNIYSAIVVFVAVPPSLLSLPSWKLCILFNFFFFFCYLHEITQQSDTHAHV